MALWNRWCSHVDSTVRFSAPQRLDSDQADAHLVLPFQLGRIHQFNSGAHVLGFVNRYFIAMFQKNVRRYFVIHLQVRH